MVNRWVAGTRQVDLSTATVPDSVKTIKMKSEVENWGKCDAKIVSTTVPFIIRAFGVL